MKTTQIIAGRYAIYDCPQKLKAFLIARETGTATKEMLMQLSDAAMLEQQEELLKRPKAPVIDLATARRDNSARNEKL